MQLKKKIQCVHCHEIIDGNKRCSCGKVVIVNNIIVEGMIGKDYIDLSQQLLNE
jgi:hypothetical protein